MCARVFCSGESFVPDEIVDLYLVEDVAVWSSGIELNSLSVVSLVEEVQIDGVGNLPSTLLWGGPLTAGSFDVVADVDRDGVYTVGVDALGDNHVNVSATMFVIPEIPLGSLLGLVACLVAIIVKSKT